MVPFLFVDECPLGSRSIPPPERRSWARHSLKQSVPTVHASHHPELLTQPQKQRQFCFVSARTYSKSRPRSTPRSNWRVPEAPGLESILDRQSKIFLKQRERRIVDRIEVITSDAKSWFERQADSSIDAFSLSNICELMSLEETGRLFTEVAGSARSGARVCNRRHRLQPSVSLVGR